MPSHPVTGWVCAVFTLGQSAPSLLAPCKLVRARNVGLVDEMCRAGESTSGRETTVHQKKPWQLPPCWVKTGVSVHPQAGDKDKRHVIDFGTLLAITWMQTK